MPTYDCIFIPGGGLLEDGRLPAWSEARVEKALEFAEGSKWIACLSAGTVHKPPPLDRDGYPIFESTAAAKTLIDRGIEKNKILKECISYDTIGNAIFSRLLFAEPLGLKSILIITSEFHLPRTERVFSWIYNLKPTTDIQLSFEGVTNVGLSPEVLAARTNKEKASLENLEILTQKISTIPQLIHWLFTEHSAYSPGSTSEPLTNDQLGSY